MKLHSITKIAAVAAIGAAPMLGMAATPPVVLDSCVKAFMTSLSTQKTAAFKLREAHYVGEAGTPDSSPLALRGNSELTLTAHDAHDNHAVARAVCTVNAQGEVVDLHSTPLFGFDGY